MTTIKIVTDSTIDLDIATLESLGVTVVPLSLTIDGETYRDRLDITPQDFLVKMKEAKELPKTSQPPVGEFLEVYDRLGADGSEIISIHMTGGMSGTVNSAETAAGMTESNVTVIDSKYISRALGFQVLKAVEMVKAGENKEEILAEISKVRENTRLFVVVDTLENLVKGGRIGKGQALLGSLLNIKPIADLSGGVYNPIGKVRSYSQVVKTLIKEMKSDLEGKKLLEVGLVHAGNDELVEALVKKIEEDFQFKVENVGYTTPIIATHTGPGTIGFMYRWES
ncbi:DegV family protein [Mangrovibacillus cuniculi]|uniref:DegV family protein n=1 Tax=Mangrovibacillus cuniculi TaxID=2593652 RepID=A0A7S8CAW4_9BACI|nr:DegV family protein [Mangrovibacillus cuniculi]QPC46619.1 DegV family protein [Mangrovibacillus cuniculi]